DICGIEEGDAPPIPTVPSARRQMAQRMIFALTGWSPARAPMQAAPRDVGVYRSRGEGPLDLLRRLRDRLSGSAVEEMESASQDEAAMTLLRLHGEGVRALMDYVALETAGKTDGFQLETALRLLYDTGDRTIYPTLIERLAASPSPLARRLLADALIESGEPSAVPALFRFAQSAAEDGVSRREALYRVCEPGAGGVPRDAVTRWLERSIADRRSPAWLRLFARFELLNDRGARARRIALAAFQGEPTASFALRGVVLKSPNGRFRISNVPPDPLVCKVDASARDRNGVLWCVVHWSYLGNDDDMWLARSTDGKHWTNLRYVMTDPVVTMDGYSQDTMKLRLTRGGIELVWPPLPNDATAKKRHSYVRSVSFADLDRDSDGDGLPDRLERAMGTDPYRRDTNGDGVSDERDKNPCYRRRPLTDEEGIYQAVMEGLCQAERFGSDGTKLGGPDAAVSLAERGQPIVLRGAARDCGLRIWGHYGPAVYLPLRSPADYAALSSYRSQYEFCAPMRDIEPQAKEDAPAAATDPFDTKLAPDPPPKAPQFADYFPVQRSKDGLRARVGFCQRGGRPLYDVEGRKIDGVWYPVQCRLVQAPGRQFINWSGPDAELVVPLRRPKP
ncbi:MAG TPA: hypothetical protein VKT77_23550, partial [Chthonomonadaceae bacterium]|nr:hypothetical protein [Chthonomonadaceae bacterium]